ncbi:hypothetical protein KIW84_050126 [Lathyrus oleraceus]|uniref:CCHC-type domain-containing protein n=1 Tax=Pisum sativum TaxID=3888 RepID=A0A9D5ABN2_PEA|nr:hypothetical protein KIW84_050126 [Pisum sativum]
MCWNCKEPGHMASSCPNEGICHTCGKTGHRARACSAPAIPPGDLRLCHNCYKLGHIAVECKQCPKSHIIGDHSGRGSFRGGGYCDVACRNCQQLGHMSRDCMGPLMICHNCGGRGHFAYERPSGRFVDRCPSDRYHPGRRY